MRTALICLAAFSIAAAQGGLDSMLNKKAVNCWDIGYNAGEAMPRVHKRGAHDSLAAIASYWEAKCGITEPLWRFNLLQAILAGRAPIQASDTTFIDRMLYYRNRIESLWELPDSKARIAEYYQYSLPPEFDDMTYGIAESLAKEAKDLDRDDSLLLLFYQNKFSRFFNEVYARDDGLVSKAFRAEAAEALGQKKLSMGLIGGYWVPLGNSSVLGDHASLGFNMGGQGRQFGLDVSLVLKLGSAGSPYVIRHKDSLVTTDYFLGGQMSLDGFFVPSALSHGRLINPCLIASVAWDGFDATKGGKNADDNKSINAFNIGLGAGNRFFYREGAYIGLEARYDIHAYDNEGGTDLSGNAVSIYLKWGFLDNVPARNRLENLGYSR